MSELKAKHQLLQNMHKIRVLQQERDEKILVHRRQDVENRKDTLHIKKEIVENGIAEWERQLSAGSFQAESLLQFQYWLGHSTEDVHEAETDLEAAIDDYRVAAKTLARSIGYQNSAKELVAISACNIKKHSERKLETRFEDLTSYRHWSNENHQ
ncbi:hypothetical protein ACFOWX_01435 [Sphingorhabdus arenilitoris]|uniref:Flagellar FliJ protein n=1 Tax=Sphingorhabdus arenilitoris TaxID=1490041 RepID=A0ABV8RF60_9SPHN